ncbi:hypothetical protein LTR10_022794 [Elasticomyces elasticus]|uniref:Uncharacterized protein n=1 Tax=Exophiala sideris TaxID=1016849 RepID=A0ABR0JNT0_9EURO|nr:hypothetical protein LTR10_022794 [Elasticomyces elasticus]KAK5036578.1 hypothetical protein LTS07_002305 [Exophiala sideris]KAK5066961.1 hypothetical protein LTR69_002309 [Exophiala sideris]KAK5185020.1 hypothetical protein LTR44_002866 [Eurotiomycetes sp. CCFEE 6388]
MDDRIGRNDRMDVDMDRMDPRLDSRLDPRIDPRIDPRMDIRTEPRANTAATRIDPRSDRGIDRRNVEPDAAGQIYQDPVTGEFYREVRQVPSRSPYPPRDEREYDVPPSRSRQPVDTPMSRGREPLRPELNEYFCPGEGIDREVIQHEICKYLGQDATCRPGRNTDVWNTSSTLHGQWSNPFVRIRSSGSVNENEGPDQVVLKVPMPTCKPDKNENDNHDTQEIWTLKTTTLTANGPKGREIRIPVMFVPWLVVVPLSLSVQDIPRSLVILLLILYLQLGKDMFQDNLHTMAQKESLGRLVATHLRRFPEQDNPQRTYNPVVVTQSEQDLQRLHQYLLPMEAEIREEK